MKLVLLITVLESLAITSWLLLRRFRSGNSKMPAKQILIPILTTATKASILTSSFEASRWSFINGWQVEPQADDRKPTFGAVAAQAGSASGQRSFARRSHQRSFKAWSQERHD
jgi:hypothetical protein